MGEALTKKQKEMLDFIVESIQLNGYAPSYREIADHFHLSSVATVHEHIKSLEDKGHLRAADGRSRATTVVDAEPETVPDDLRQRVELPLVGIIAAGEPIEAIEDRETIGVPADLVRDANAFVLKVRGESMIDEGILDGDYVVVERNYYPKNGDVVVALLDNTYATLKRYFREKTRIRLQPANKKLKPLYAKNPAIQGIVRGVYRQYSAV